LTERGRNTLILTRSIEHNRLDVDGLKDISGAFMREAEDDTKTKVRIKLIGSCLGRHV